MRSRRSRWPRSSSPGSPCPTTLKRGGEMSTRAVIIGLVVAGVVVAIVLGLFGQTASQAETKLCTSLEFLQSDVASLKNTDLATASKESVQATVDTIQADLAQTRVDAKDVLDLNTQQLQDAWSEYGEAIRGIPDTTPPTEALNAVKQHTETLATTVKDTIGDLDCSTS